MNTERKIPVVYVGKKETAIDNVARTGLVWEGYGDCHEVTIAQAKTLIKYPDQWALADQDDLVLLGEVGGLEGKDESGNTVDVDPSELNKPFEKMNKQELFAYAKDKWGKELDPKKSKKDMIDQIEEWSETIDVTIGKV